MERARAPRPTLFSALLTSAVLAQACAGAACGDVQRELRQTGTEIEQAAKNHKEIGEDIGEEANKVVQPVADAIDEADAKLKADQAEAARKAEADKASDAGAPSTPAE